MTTAGPVLQLCGLDFFYKIMVFQDGSPIRRCQKHSQVLPMTFLEFSGIA